MARAHAIEDTGTPRLAAQRRVLQIPIFAVVIADVGYPRVIHIQVVPKVGDSDFIHDTGKPGQASSALAGVLQPILRAVIVADVGKP